MISAELRKEWTTTFNKRFTKESAKTYRKPKAIKPEPNQEKPVEIEPEKIEEPVVEKETQKVTVKFPKRTKEILKAIKNIQKNAEKLHMNPKLFENNGWIACTDGHRVLRTVADGIIKETDEPLYDKMNLDGYFNSKEYIEVQSPTLFELKVIERQAKVPFMQKGKLPSGKVAYVFDINGEKYHVNIKYLMDGILATGSTTFLYQKRLAPIIFKSEDGKTEYMTLPINGEQEAEAGARYIG